MLWPFNHFRKPPAPLRGTIEAIYGMIVAQAREPRFYRELGVADTVNGRFDMLLLHLWLLLQQLKEIETSGASQESLSQGLIDRFCSDMDHNLRELGTSDLKVPKKMQEFGRAFYGRAAAYDRALAEGPEALALALDKNIYNGTDLAQARRLAGYVAEATAALAALDETTVANGSWRFPPPVATEMMTK
ncbi:ubiquinol-cytochrome C chaperone [Rhodopseudomonas sp. P2A-2r]|uniref:ubiquinol-cytochrome C chaperone family protein n=1 Tax=Rhodopseudomonas sp. P2A-2r TaxID=2991972 RepID=UPI002234E36B|nr:ubiquinol-cytochrome C chaperone family protein [Rhodopseudomonas sp. P2A-2r]UZE51860.1 ubiquinol-cytochrome C chaperone [Rhodopseudomonas sp. P2A-2r]